MGIKIGNRLIPILFPISGFQMFFPVKSAKQSASTPECFLAIRKTSSEEQKNTYVTIQTTSKHLVSLLNSR